MSVGHYPSGGMYSGRGIEMNEIKDNTLASANSSTKTRKIKSQLLSGRGLKLSGGRICDIYPKARGKGLRPVGRMRGGKEGKGLKLAGKLLGGYTALGTVSGLDPKAPLSQNLTQLLGGLLLGGISAALYKAGRDKAKKSQSGKGVNNMKNLQTIHMINSHPHKIHVSDLNLSKPQIDKILSNLNVIEKKIKDAGMQKGSGKFGNLLKRFFKGQTKYKPSDLLRNLSQVGTVLGTIATFIPGVGIPVKIGLAAASTASKIASQELKQRGKGMTRDSKMFYKRNGEPRKIQLKEIVYKYPSKDFKTSGGLKYKDLIVNKRGKVVSKKKSEIGKRISIKYLQGSNKK
jgi:hypothetical protein